jgi:hypothetical protein
MRTVDRPQLMQFVFKFWINCTCRLPPAKGVCIQGTAVVGYCRSSVRSWSPSWGSCASSHTHQQRLRLLRGDVAGLRGGSMLSCSAHQRGCGGCVANCRAECSAAEAAYVVGTASMWCVYGSASER